MTKPTEIRGPHRYGTKPLGPGPTVLGGLLAELPANRPRREHVAVDVDVVVPRIVPDGLDQLLAHARDAAAGAIGTREGNIGEQRDHHRSEVRGRSNVDVRRKHGAVDPRPAQVEADLTLALVERDERRPGGVGIARSRHLRRPGERGRERTALPMGGSAHGEHGDHPEGGSEEQDATSHCDLLVPSDDNRVVAYWESVPGRVSDLATEVG